MYRFTVDSSFDESFREVVDKEINRILSSDNTDYQQTPSILTDNLTYDELDDAIKSLPLNKAPGQDNVTYKHIKYGGETLKACLFNLFDNILVTGMIPVKFKHGLIITLHKVAGKSFSNPDNYRAISLLPSVAKIFEKILLNRNFNNIQIYTPPSTRISKGKK